MKNIVIFDEYNELDLKPSELIEHYVQMVKEDVIRLFIKPDNLQNSVCPFCRFGETKGSFNKFGLSYQECASCRTLYVSPRPKDAAVHEFYSGSESRKFWREKLLSATGEARKEKILKPRFEWVADSTREYLPDAKHWVDVNTNQFGYIKGMLEEDFPSLKILVNPYFPEDCDDVKGKADILKAEQWANSLKEKADIVSLFEVVNHTADVETLFKNIDKALKPGGLVFMTSILSSGFDIQELWAQSDNIYPPDRLNVPSAIGLKVLFERFGLECLEFSTPGTLDLEIIANALKHNVNVKISRFSEGLISSQDENLKNSFQEFLQENRLSSYGRILLKKRG